jgi:alkylation response protein AidB-like acyl-CoA dehydrogenase
VPWLRDRGAAAHGHRGGEPAVGLTLPRNLLRACSVTQSNLANGKYAGQRENQKRIPRRCSCTTEITQIYEGTNQIQRMVMGRQLLK